MKDGGFQDYIDFGVYTYASVTIQDNPYFVPLFERKMESVAGYLDNYEQFVVSIGQSDSDDELATNYDFDLYYLYEKDGYPMYGCYDLWILDSQTKNSLLFS